MNKPKIAVLMSTYNGEKFIREQINSILAQEGVDVHIYVRDDSSNDNTIEILQSYCDDYRLTLYKSEENVGAAESFMRLLYKVADDEEPYVYYAFADQDDIWKYDKLRAAVKMLENNIIEPRSIPLLYCSNQIKYIDGKECGLRFDQDMTPTLLSALNKNDLSGCTYVMNRELVEEITSVAFPSSDVLSNRFHDSWCMMIALMKGKVIYDSESYILYRLHDNNEVGIKEVSFRDYINRLRGAGKHGTNRRNLRSKTAEDLIRRFETADDRQREILADYAYYRSDRKIKKRMLKDEEVMSYVDSSKSIWGGIRVLLNLV